MKAKLLAELAELRQRIIGLERLEEGRTQEEQKLRASEQKYCHIAHLSGVVIVGSRCGRCDISV